jgi:hypothetical protein
LSLLRNTGAALVLGAETVASKVRVEPGVALCTGLLSDRVIVSAKTGDGASRSIVGTNIARERILFLIIVVSLVS